MNNMLKYFCVVFYMVFCMEGMAQESLDTKTNSVGPVAGTPVGGDPISMSNGAFFEDWNLFDLGGPLGLDFSLHYRPALWNHSPTYLVPRLDAGYGVFTCNHTIELITMTHQTSSNRQAIVFFGDHEEVLRYNEASEEYETTGSIPYVLNFVDGSYVLSDPQQQLVYIFAAVPDSFVNEGGFDSDWWGRVQTVMDRNGNRLNYTYTKEQQPRLQQISDGLGRTVTLSYFAEWAPLESVTDSNGRSYTFTSGGSTFSSMTDPQNNTTTFDVGSDKQTQLITRIVRPEGNSHIDQTWTATPKGQWFFGVETQYDAYSNRTDIFYSTYSNGDLRARFTYPDGSSNEFQNVNERFPVHFTDRGGNQADVGYNANHQMTAITDRLGDTTALGYHPETGLVSSFTNALGNGISHTYAASAQTFTNPVGHATFSLIFYDRIRSDYPDGSHEVSAYDSRGNLTNYTDQAGAHWSFSYNAKGQPLTVSNPNGGIITRTYNADGTTESVTDSETGTTLFDYDTYKRLVAINPPGAGQTVLAYDSMNRITAITNALGRSIHFAYDNNGNRTTTTDPEGHEISYEYDLMDRIVKTSGRTGGTSAVAYTYDGLPATLINANGIVTTIGYDSVRNPTHIQTGGTAISLSLDYDLEGVLKALTSPEGRTTKYLTDALGNTTAIVTPGGQTNLIARDSMTRVTHTTDPLGRMSRYDYDAMSRLTQITLPDTNSVTYTRDGLGNLTNIRDLNGQSWDFAYSPMGRLISTTDPLSRTNIYTRDVRARIATITYADGSTVSNTYDSVGKLTHVQMGGTAVPLSLNYAYDSNGVLTNTTDLALTHDQSGRILTSIYNGRTFGVTRDSGGRIATATYGGALTVTYTYDAGDRLKRTADTLGNQIDFAYDADGNITNIVRANGVNASYTWDSSGRLSHIQDGSLIDLHPAYDAAGQLSSISGTYPLSPVDTNSTIQEYSFDAASQVSASGYAYDDRGRATALPGHTLAWDAAERLVMLDGVVAFGYNGLNEIVSRVEGATTTRYHHNHAFGLAPVVAEEQNAAILRYYVYTPSGQLLYSIAPQNGNAIAYYHRDLTGSTLALSDGSGTITDRYAYSPYGKLLNHTGSSDQPYTFVGTLGVRREGDLYQMRRRYYDPVTARFLSKEPIWPRTDDPQSLNPYQYAGQNPLQYVDPQGTMKQYYESAAYWEDVADTYDAELQKVNGELKSVQSDFYGEWRQQPNFICAPHLTKLYEKVHQMKVAAKLKALREREAELNKKGDALWKRVNQNRNRAKKIRNREKQIRNRGKAKAWADHLKALDARGLNGERGIRAVSFGMGIKPKESNKPVNPTQGAWATFKDVPDLHSGLGVDPFYLNDVIANVLADMPAQVQRWMLDAFFGGSE